MKFTLLLKDKPGSQSLRDANRADHIKFVDEGHVKVLSGGPLFGADGRVAGSLIIIEADDWPQAQAFAAADPYQKAGIFESSQICEYKELIKDGKRG